MRESDAMNIVGTTEGHRAPPSLMPLFRELCNLKRVRSAGKVGSIAERLFASAWAGLASGRSAYDVMRTTLSAALAATRLGDLDMSVLTSAGIPAAEARVIIREAAQDAASPVDPLLRAAILDPADSALSPIDPPNFVARLAAQPRAGATCPGRGRLILEPPESHADHCALVALIGALIAPAWEAESATVFVSGLAHHLHNALMPDSGFTGEVTLGDWLNPAITRATELALTELSAAPRLLVMSARSILPDAATAEGCAFHAADTLDRVLQVEHHLRPASTTMHSVLVEMELVHAGPVRPFQEAVLARMGLAA